MSAKSAATAHERSSHPNEVRRDARLRLLLGRQLLVRRRRGVDDERLGVADVREVARELHRVDDCRTHSRVALDPEVEHAPKLPRAQQAQRHLVRRVAWKAKVRHPRDCRVCLEPPMQGTRTC